MTDFKSCVCEMESVVCMCSFAVLVSKTVALSDDGSGESVLPTRSIPSLTSLEDIIIVLYAVCALLGVVVLVLFIIATYLWFKRRKSKPL